MRSWLMRSVGIVERSEVHDAPVTAYLRSLSLYADRLTVPLPKNGATSMYLFRLPSSLPRIWNFEIELV
jgi:hypothetical protein